ncbi:translation initiation factor IF-2 [Candidatus Similichlamydia epinepheli]|uniref:translation initiation factor IF-2 n=1 Tax=Candidatus Similichlamydia epinepheli TaxID=1903953 RepID=UPI000D3768AC|nr:translation initiation factor IF-2 [Candidatus Similichlamydia epinepheli]
MKIEGVQKEKTKEFKQTEEDSSSASACSSVVVEGAHAGKSKTSARKAIKSEQSSLLQPSSSDDLSSVSVDGDLNSSVRVSSSESFDIVEKFRSPVLTSSTDQPVSNESSDSVPVAKVSTVSDSDSHGEGFSLRPRGRVSSDKAQKSEFQHRPFKGSGSFFSRDKKSSIFSRGKSRHQGPQQARSPELPPGFGSDSSSQGNIPDWVQTLDHSRAGLGPTGRHVKDMVTPPVCPSSNESVGAQPDKQSIPRSRSQFKNSPAKSEKTFSSFSSAPRDRGLFSKKVFSEAASAPVPSVGRSRGSGFSSSGKDSSSRDRGGGGRGEASRSKNSGKHGEGRRGQSFRSGYASSSHSKKPSLLKKAEIDAPPVIPENLKVALPISVSSLASSMKMRTAQLISRMFMQGVVLRPNDVLNQEALVHLIGSEFGCTIEVNLQALERGQVFRKTILEELKQADPGDLVSRPPVVSLVGHVDHGKTSLIDAIRKSDLARHETGEITQHIGAFTIFTEDASPATILDTPGHEAFSAMRDRGIRISDIVLLVVSGDEGIKTQTEEAISLIKESGSSLIVVITKSDRPNFDEERVMKQLANCDLLPESWGGSVVTTTCSAKKGDGISELLELVLLQASLLQLQANPKDRARGVIIESRIDSGLGPSATILVQNGTLFQGDLVVAGSSCGRIRTIKNDRGKHLKEVASGFAAFVSGFSSPPNVGEPFVVVPNEQEAKWATELHSKSRVAVRAPSVSPESFMELGLVTKKRTLFVMLCGDVYGSVEALGQALREIPSERVEIEIVHQAVGVIGESLVSLAAASKAVIIGFQTSVDIRAQVMAKNLCVSIHIFQIIYRAVERVTELMQGLLDKTCHEKFSGIAEVRAIFKSSKFGVIAGCGVVNGVVKRNQLIRVMRDGKALHKGRIISMRTGRDDLKESSKGFECGIIVENFSDFQIGDELHSFDLIYLSQGLLECDDEKQD